MVSSGSDAVSKNYAAGLEIHCPGGACDWAP